MKELFELVLKIEYAGALEVYYILTELPRIKVKTCWDLVNAIRRVSLCEEICGEAGTKGVELRGEYTLFFTLYTQ